MSNIYYEETSYLNPGQSNSNVGKMDPRNSVMIPDMTHALSISHTNKFWKFVRSLSLWVWWLVLCNGPTLSTYPALTETRKVMFWIQRSWPWVRATLESFFQNAYKT